MKLGNSARRKIISNQGAVISNTSSGGTLPPRKHSELSGEGIVRLEVVWILELEDKGFPVPRCSWLDSERVLGFRLRVQIKLTKARTRTRVRVRDDT